jgi:hypothetical protein
MDSDPQINISRIKVAGVGGFGLVVVVAAMAFDLPAVRVFVIAAITGGLIGAAWLVVYRRWRGPGPVEPPSIFMLDPTRLKDRAASPSRAQQRNRNLKLISRFLILNS